VFKVGIIGLGYIGANHLRSFAQLPDVDVVGIVDTNQDRIAAVLGKQSIAHSFSDYRDLLALRDLDLIVVCLPNNQHAAATIDALNAGHDVLCEKPMATALADAEAMCAAAEENGCVLSIVKNFRWEFFGPDAFHLKKMIGDGELGQIYFVRVQYLRHTTFPEGGAWRWNLSQRESGGGALIDLGPHMLDLAMFLLDDYAPKSVSGFTHNGLIKDSPVDDFASGAVSLAGGARLHVELAWNSHNRSVWRLCFYGDKGGAIIDAQKPAGRRITRLVAANSELIEGVIDPDDIAAPPEASLQQHVVARLRAGEVPECSAERAYQVMRVIDAWYRSSETGDVVTL
jgi:predicted dehydrogenase